MKLWAGRFQKETDQKTNDFNSSISFDSRMAREDIEGSIAHAAMLGACGVIDKDEAGKICIGLEQILRDLESGALQIDPSAEDIHTFIEGELTQRLGDAGKRLHTARSRNDQVALDVRLWPPPDGLCGDVSARSGPLEGRPEKDELLPPGQRRAGGNDLSAGPRHDGLDAGV